MNMYKRVIAKSLRDAVTDTPVVYVRGARQVGKSTLVKAELPRDYNFYTLDDATTLASAREDPQLFVEQLSLPCIIDEVQRCPELFLPIKKAVDENRGPGQYVLTGSSNVLNLPKMADSLAGRMEVLTLWPLSQGEISGVPTDFINRVVSDKLLPPKESMSVEELAHKLVAGGYPDALLRAHGERRQAWFKSYITTIIERDIRDLSVIDGMLEIPNLLKVLSNRSSQLLNMAEISRVTKIPHTSLKRYITLLINIFIVTLLPAWAKNPNKIMAKSPKVLFNDTGLLCQLMGYDSQKLLADRSVMGHVLENFIAVELLKQISWTTQMTTLHHYRSHGGAEIDLIVELPDSRLIALEIKLASSVSASDFRWINELEKDLGGRLFKGIVLYSGDKIHTFGKNKLAVPINCLWSG